MSTFTHYLTEAAKSYDYKVKVAGTIADDFKNRMETALQKFELAKMSAGKKTPIQSVPLDFPRLSNEEVTIFDVTTNYPCSTNELTEYLADYMNINASLIVVRKPGEPTEEYQQEAPQRRGWYFQQCQWGRIRHEQEVSVQWRDW